jgi:hypothetical protein
MPKKIPNRTKCVRIKNTDRAIALKDYARLKNISESTVRYRLRVGDCQGYKIGGKWYIYKELQR